MTATPQIAGIFPAAMTMFTEDGDLDEAGTRAHVEYLLRGGAHGLIACGTSGEFIAMTEEERLRVIGWVVEAAAGRVPVYAGTGHYSTRLTISMSQVAERLGAAGLILILPYYQKPPKEAILRHYREIRRASGLPIMLYNNPGYAGTVELNVRDVCTLVDEGVIQSVKQTFENVAATQDVLYACGDRLRVFYGSFRSPMEALLAGAHGWISGFLNFLAADCVALYDACASGHLELARSLWHKLLPFVHLYTQQMLGPVNDLAIYRAGLELLGQHGGYSRAPFYPLTAAQRETLRQLMQRQGVLP